MHKMMLSRLKKVTVVYKKTVYQKYVLEKNRTDLKKLISSKHLSAKTMMLAHLEHQKSLDRLRWLFYTHKIEAKFLARQDNMNFGDSELVITLGGDGTFLRTVPYVKNQPVLAVNSAPLMSVGALCACTIQELEQKFLTLVLQKWTTRALRRIRITVGGKKIFYSPINDVLFTNGSPAATSRYLVVQNKEIEDHKSSGLWLSTPLGSTAAIKAAGGVRQKLSEHRLQYLVREPYQRTRYKFTRGFLAKSEKLTLISKMIEASLYLDGPIQEIKVNYGDKIVFELAKKDFFQVVL